YRRVKPAFDEMCRRIIDAAERCDDSQGSAARVETLMEELIQGERGPIGLVFDLTSTTMGDAAYWLRRYEDRARSASEQGSQDERLLWEDFDAPIFQAKLLRELVGNPFRPTPAIPPEVLAWNDGCVVKLAGAIYDRRDFRPEPMGVLADALEDAG